MSCELKGQGGSGRGKVVKSIGQACWRSSPSRASAPTMKSWQEWVFGSLVLYGSKLCSVPFFLNSVLINGETLISQILVAEENVVHYQAAQTLPGGLWEMQILGPYTSFIGSCVLWFWSKEELDPESWVKFASEIPCQKLCVCVCVCARACPHMRVHTCKHAQSCPAFCDPMDCSPPVSSNKCYHV